MEKKESKERLKLRHELKNVEVKMDRPKPVELLLFLKDNIGFILPDLCRLVVDYAVSKDLLYLLRPTPESQNLRFPEILCSQKHVTKHYGIIPAYEGGYNYECDRCGNPWDYSFGYHHCDTCGNWDLCPNCVNGAFDSLDISMTEAQLVSIDPTDHEILSIVSAPVFDFRSSHDDAGPGFLTSTIIGNRSHLFLFNRYDTYVFAMNVKTNRCQRFDMDDDGPPGCSDFSLESWGYVLGLTDDHLWLTSGTDDDEHTPSSTIRQFSLSTGQWKLCKAVLPAPRLQHSICSVPGGFILTGGETGATSDVLKDCHRATIDKDGEPVFTKLPDLNETRFSHGSIYWNNHILVFGGSDRILDLKTEKNRCLRSDRAEILDLNNVENGWRSVPFPPFPKRTRVDAHVLSAQLLNGSVITVVHDMYHTPDIDVTNPELKGPSAVCVISTDNMSSFKITALPEIKTIAGVNCVKLFVVEN